MDEARGVVYFTGREEVDRGAPALPRGPGRLGAHPTVLRKTACTPRSGARTGASTWTGARAGARRGRRPFTRRTGASRTILSGARRRSAGRVLPLSGALVDSRRGRRSAPGPDPEARGLRPVAAPSADRPRVRRAQRARWSRTSGAARTTRVFPQALLAAGYVVASVDSRIATGASKADVDLALRRVGGDGGARRPGGRGALAEDASPASIRIASGSGAGAGEARPPCSLLTRSQEFKAGIAVAPVTDRALLRHEVRRGLHEDARDRTPTATSTSRW